MMLLAPTQIANADPEDQLPINPLGNDTTGLSTAFATTGKWFVELDSEPTSAGGTNRTIRTEQQEFLSDARAEGLPAEVSRTFSTLFNGFTVNASSEEAATYADIDGVAAVYPVLPVTQPEPQLTDPELYSAIAMTGVDVAQSDLGYTGEGIKVGIIDSGVDYDHPDFGGSGTDGTTTFPTARVAYGYDFVGDDFNADPNSPQYSPVPKPDAQPDDCGGHGTHVAGIVGASGELTGAAPEATLGAYRVFGCDGATDTDIILAALEQARSDGMDVVNMSLGASFQSWPQYPTSTAADRLVDDGIIVVASAGNSGTDGTQAVGGPSSGSKVISVASYDNTRVLSEELIVQDAGDDDLSVGFATASGAPAPSSELDGTPIKSTTDPVGCEAEPEDLDGFVAITSRGDCTFHQKAVNAQDAGAEALIIYNNVAGFLNATVTGEVAITIPVIGMLQAEGEAILALTIDDGSAPTVVFTGELSSKENPTAGLVSSFSSWGLAADLSLKPDLGAPGGSIYSTYPLEEDGFATLSGTSMASPHVAGAVALMLEANPELTPAEILARLQNTATPSNQAEEPDAGILDAAHRQGAGLIHVDRAILSTTTVTPGKISAGESADGPHTERLTITNRGAEAVTWDVGFEDAIGTHVDSEEPDSTQADVVFTADAASVRFSRSSVTVEPGRSESFIVTISPDDEAVEGTQYSGYVQLTANDGTDTISVPFAGMAGDYGALTLLPDLDDGLPALVEVTKCDAWEDQQCVDDEPEIDDVSADKVFALGTDLPTVLAHIAYPVARLSVVVLEVSASGTPIEASSRTAYAIDYVGRDSGYSLWTWDGRLPSANGLLEEVDAGNYVLRLTALEPDGDGGTQSWTSPVFGVKNAPVAPLSPTPTVTVTQTVPPVPPTTPLVDVYSTPGYHTVNGRRWFTTCEKYSQTTRCRTSIFATTISSENGRYVSKNGWVFNNLTYLPSPRSLWENNPLGNTGSWTAADGRKWRTECDTPATGRNGCRSYAQASVIGVARQGSGYTYEWSTKWVLNNIVRFS